MDNASWPPTAAPASGFAGDPFVADSPPREASARPLKPESEVETKTPNSRPGGPTVEVIGATPRESISESRPKSSQIHLRIPAHQPDPGQAPSATETIDPCETSGLDLHEYDLAMNVLPQRLAHAVEVVPMTTQPESETLPPLNMDPLTDEPVLDVRDFLSCCSELEPIAGSYELEQDAFDYLTISPPARLTDSNAVLNPQAPNDPNDVSREKELFLLENHQVMEIDGNDGFSQIDLQCFPVSSAQFENGRILIDDPESQARFSIVYQNVPLAIFAGNTEVQLSPAE